MVSEQLLEAILGVNKEVYRVETERKDDMSTLKIVLNENREKKKLFRKGRNEKCKSWGMYRDLREVLRAMKEEVNIGWDHAKTAKERR